VESYKLLSKEVLLHVLVKFEVDWGEKRIECCKKVYVWVKAGNVVINRENMNSVFKNTGLTTK